MKRVIGLMALVLMLSGCSMITGPIEEQLDKVNIDYDDLKDEFDDLKEKIDEKEDLIAILEEQKIALEDGQGEMSYDVNVLKSDYEAAIMQIDALEQEVATLEDEVTMLNTDLSSVGEGYINGYALIASGYGQSFDYLTLPYDENVVQVVQIVGFEPELTEPYEMATITYEISKTSEGLLSVPVLGTIYNVRVQQRIWNEETNQNEPGEIVIEIGDVSDTFMMFQTIFPEGMPHYEILWENSANETKGLFISYDGYGFNGSFIFSE